MCSTECDLEIARPGGGRVHYWQIGRCIRYSLMHLRMTRVDMPFPPQKWSFDDVQLLAMSSAALKTDAGQAFRPKNCYVQAPQACLRQVLAISRKIRRPWQLRPRQWQGRRSRKRYKIEASKCRKEPVIWLIFPTCAIVWPEMPRCRVSLRSPGGVGP